MAYIPRRLIVADKSGSEVEYTDDQFFGIDAPLVILGEPGAGKSSLVEKFAETSGSKLYKPSDIELSPVIEVLTLPARTIIDGLDEVTAYKIGTPIIEILSKVSSGGYSNFIITCRAVDWQHAFNSSAISRNWQKEPVVGCLLPLNDQEIIAFIESNSSQDAKVFMKEAEKHDAVDILRNPQNLTMLLKTVERHGWPNKKSDLYEKACEMLLEEDNEIHRSIGNRIRPQTDVLIDAAGFICAQLLLSGLSGVSIDARKDLNLPKSSDLVMEGMDESVIRFALSTKVFEVVGHDVIEPCHRTIAEFLAAKWLSKALRDKLSLRRLERLFCGSGNIIPAALRGLHAWIATQCPIVADEFIARDPYGFFRYGDPAMLSVDQAKKLIKSLEGLADADPYFRSEDWHSTFGRGFAKPELRDDIIRVIRNPKTPYQLSHLIIESLQGDKLAGEISHVLEEIALDSAASIMERNAAINALLECKDVHDILLLVDKLQVIGDIESLKLAIDIIQKKVEEFTGQKIANILILLENSLSKDSPNYAGIGYGLDKKMSLSQIEEALATLSKNLRDKPRNQRMIGVNTEEWILRLVEEYLRRDALPLASDLWGWLCNIDRHGYGKENWHEFSKEYFGSRSKFRQEIQAEAIKSVKKYDDLWLTLWQVGDLGAGLRLHEDDVIFHLNGLIKEKESFEDWPLRWRDLVQWARKHIDFTGAAINYAEKQAEEHSELKEQLEGLNKPQLDNEWQKKFQEQERRALRDKNKRTKARQESYKEVREILAEGKHLGALDAIAKSYLNRYSDIRSEDSPYLRVVELVGEEMAPTAMLGLEAALKSTDIPSARQMATLNATEGKVYYLESVLVACCSKLLSENKSLSQLPMTTLRSALAACHWDLHYIGDKITPMIQKQLQKIVFANKEEKESFVKDTMEPYFESSADHVSGLYRISRDDEFSDIAGSLAIEWLKKYPNVSTDTLKEFIFAAIRYGDRDQVVAIIRNELQRGNQEEKVRRGIWMGAAFLLDYEHNAEKLAEYIKEDKLRLWPIREIAFPDRELKGYWPELNLSQHYFIITGFGPSWPPESYPAEGWSGDQNPWDATKCIQARIEAIANNLSDEASILLKGLIDYKGLEGYQNQIKHGFAQQTRRIAEESKEKPSLAITRRVLLRNEPANIGDLQAIVIDELEMLQKRIKDGPTNDVLTFWDGEEPHGENYCRDRIAAQLTPYIERLNIRAHTEGTMPDGNRCDLLNTYNAMDLPIEIKGQWHPEVWIAASNQMQNYTRDYRAEGLGIYLVLWFGKIDNGHRKNPHGWTGQAVPKTIEEMRELMHDRFDKNLSDKTKIFVLDLSR